MVAFTNICAACEPIQTVNMLNSMYSKFDRLTSVHEVYKVRLCVSVCAGAGRIPGVRSSFFSPLSGLGFGVDARGDGRKS